jgi:hypothetical protein
MNIPTPDEILSSLDYEERINETMERISKKLISDFRTDNQTIYVEVSKETPIRNDVIAKLNASGWKVKYDDRVLTITPYKPTLIDRILRRSTVKTELLRASDKP